MAANKKLNIINRGLGYISLMVEKYKTSIVFQSIRKEDLYKKGRKGISLNYIFIIGSILFENNHKIKIHNTVQYFNLKCIITIRKFSRNLIILKKCKYFNNKIKWL